MRKKNRILSVLTAAVLGITGACVGSAVQTIEVDAADSIESSYDWDTVDIAGGGFVSGIITGDDQMYARTDVGGAYRYDYDIGEWVQLLDFITEEDRGYLSVDAMCVDPNDDDILYLLCGCAYFSGARTAIFRSYDAGETFDIIEVTDLIQVHGNGYGRQCGEAIAVDPDNPNIIYCGGDAAYGSSGLIMSKDGGDTWTSVDGYSDLGFFTESINWPTWESRICKVNTTAEYGSQNGVSSIAIVGGKVYVGTSMTGSGNMVVADVGSDDFEVLSDDLPTSYYTSRINVDADGNLLISYIAGLAFDGSAGGTYKYNTTTGEVTDISPCSNSIGAVFSDPNNSDYLIATTCGVWYSQLWYADAWNDDAVCWGDRLFKSTDGGETWTSMTAGNESYWSGPLEAAYLQDGGHSWIQNKAIHWSGAVVFDPRNSGKMFVTSGNGVFACDDVWTDIPETYFAADGIEEVVCLDFTSSTNGNSYSAIGDYDGFIHTTDGDAIQYSPTMDTIAENSSTGAIAYCPTNPDIMVRCSESGSGAFYSTDAGSTWTQLSGGLSAATAAINELEDGSYRIYMSASGKISYTDDFGATWNTSTISGDSPSSDLWVKSDAENPQYVYAYGYYYNAYYFYSKPSADISDARYLLMVSDDYGETFTAQTICQYDECDSAYRIAYLDEGTIAIAAGWYGAYLVTDYGQTVTKMDSVYYCKTMGYGIGENEGDPNALYMYGRPTSSDPEGIYRSTDCGETWLLINENHLYGGTGNGNFLVGDMTTFGKVYMSTVGCGIVVGTSSGSEDPTPATSTTTTTTSTTITTTTTTTTTTTITITTTSSTDQMTTTSETTGTDETTIESTEMTTTTTMTTSESGTETEASTTSSSDGASMYGDVNLDGTVTLADIVLLSKANAENVELNAEAKANADVDLINGVDSSDALIILRFLVQLIDALPYVD
ncbi:MAG: 1,4-beta-glucanase [Ruminococcus sp.]|nr:1,4-beta-glucanase [Ruminococcus sp.]